jgi:hypothetical protein
LSKSLRVAAMRPLGRNRKALVSCSLTTAASFCRIKNLIQIRRGKQAGPRAGRHRDVEFSAGFPYNIIGRSRRD